MIFSLVILIFSNIIFSHRAFNDFLFFERYKLHVGEVLYSRQYDRLISSSFLHCDWNHLFFNMFSLYIFSPIIVDNTFELYFLILYFFSVLGSNIFSVFLNRNKSYHSSVGASGGVTGIIFAAISLFPQIRVTIFLIPMPAWLFAIIYLTYSLFNIRKEFVTLISYDIYIGGAILGLLSIFVYHPALLLVNFWYILLISLPILYFFYDTFFIKKK